MTKTPLSKACQTCTTIFDKPRTCGLPEWERRRFCSYACKARAQIDAPSPKRGKSYGPSRAQKVACRICGSPTRYSGANLTGMVHCGQDACRDASKALKNAAISERHSADYQAGKRRRLTENWVGVARVSKEERCIAPLLVACGWTQQFGFTTGISDIHLPRYFILDFAQPERCWYVEIDGSVHRGARKTRDVRKDTIMQQRGWRGLRVPASLVATDVDAAVHQITSFFN